MKEGIKKKLDEIIKNESGVFFDKFNKNNKL
jgi:hypothetical protein